jgi:hypothetical protein
MSALRLAILNERKRQMTTRKRIGIAIVFAMVGVLGIGLGGRFYIPDMSAFISSAAAQMNRNMSPVRVQNSARADWSGCIPALGGC